MVFETFHGMRVRTGGFYLQDCQGVQEVIIENTYATHVRPTRGDGEVVFDIGSHIGSFAVHWRNKNPKAIFVCVEVAPENIPILIENVGHFARVVHGACTYEASPIRLLNSVMENGVATGGSIVTTDNPKDFNPHHYWLDERPIRRVTLESLMAEASVDRIDVLKLDCEGSEFSILENCDCLDRIGFICGEFHDRTRWDELQNRLFRDWPASRGPSLGEHGIFHLQNPNWDWDSYGRTSGRPE